MSSKSSAGLIRLFSTFTKLSKSKTTKTNDIAQSQVQKALSLLKDSKFNFETITEEDKNKYIKDFTQILSTGLHPKKVNEASTQHFDQSILGLNQLLTKTGSPLSSKVSTLDTMSVKELISKVKAESELLSIYDDLVNNNKLNQSNFRLIVFNRSLRDLDHILNKLNFVNHDGKFDDLKILIVAKAHMLKNHQIASDLYSKNIDKWLYSREMGKLSTVLEKTLYQVIYKHDNGVSGLLNDLNHTISSYIFLIETMPRKIGELRLLQLDREFKLSKNQELFLNFTSYITSKPKTPQSINSLKRLIKLSTENQIHKEEYTKDSELTIHKYRFLSGVSELAEDLANDYGADEPQLNRLNKSIHETDDLLHNETVLKFI